MQNNKDGRFKKIREKCRRCGNTRFRTRKNYPFGKKSKVVITKFCKKCGWSNEK